MTQCRGELFGHMNDDVRTALTSDRVIDITTIGRKTGRPRRIEIWFHNLDDRIFITGMPGRRSWYANLRANPDFTFHLKDSTEADLAARATAITDPVERREILTEITSRVGAAERIDAWVERSPLIEVELAEEEGLGNRPQLP